MTDPLIVTTLRAKRTDLERTITILEDQMKAARVALSHVSAVLQLYERGDEPVRFPVHMDLNRLFGRAELWTLAKASMEAAGQPQTTRELAIYVIAAKGWDADDRPLRTAVTYRIVQSLARQMKRGKVTSPGKRSGVNVWALPVSRPGM